MKLNYMAISVTLAKIHTWAFNPSHLLVCQIVSYVFSSQAMWLMIFINEFSPKKL